MTIMPELIETYDHDGTYLYGLWRITLPTGEPTGEPTVFDIGCIIGVPPSDRATYAASAGPIGPFLSAWYADTSDWNDCIEKDVGLQAMMEHVAALWDANHAPAH